MRCFRRPGVLAICLTIGALSTRAANAAYVRDGNGKIDRDILKIDADFLRTNRLISGGMEAGVHLGAIQTMTLTGPDTELENARSQYQDGKWTRDKFLTLARQKLAKRRAAIDAALGANKQKAQEGMSNPYVQVQLFDDLFRIALDELRLPPELSEATAGKIAQHNYDADKERTDRAFREKTGEPVGPPRDAAWVEAWENQITFKVMKQLSVPQRQQIVIAWPILYPNGPAAPATDDAAYAGEPPKLPGGDSESAKKNQTKPETKPARPVAAKPPVEEETAPIIAKSGEWQDLLPLEDVKANALSCEWKTTDAGISNVKQTVPHGPATIGLPVKPTGSFELEFTFVRNVNRRDVCVAFPVGDRPALIRLGHGNGENESGEVNFIDGTGTIADNTKTREDSKSRIGLGIPHDVMLRVVVHGENANITLTMDKRPLLNWTGPRAKLKSDRTYSTEPRFPLGFGVQSWIEVEFSKVRIRSLSGTIEKVEP